MPASNLWLFIRSLMMPQKNLLLFGSKVQLNKYETDQYFLQNFHFTTMLIHAFCKICDREIVFVLN